MESDKHNESTLKPWLWKKGFCPNPAGRPKGKTMKEYAKEYLARMTDEERDEWLEGLGKDVIWEMAEGRPENKTDLTTGGEKISVNLVNYGDKPAS